MLQSQTYNVVIAKTGLDGHTRGAVSIVKGLRELGMNAWFTGIRRTPEEIAEIAAKVEAHCIGVSFHSGTHLEQMPRVLRTLEARGLHVPLLLAGGIIPSADIHRLLEMGVSGVFTPGASIASIARFIQDRVQLSEASPFTPQRFAPLPLETPFAADHFSASH
ncbi:cobalamin B12-binding domain-containing protein [Paenibacillus turpanensis]|uniref:cobalamin B12-binding domain-containing protein n=1 Tax=Paenibacillus turpanensis TaxID=2689078 RepID=UPI001408B8A4|nr:cobalamin-dependent protein [Paenibacillus turpanensis]